MIPEIEDKGRPHRKKFLCIPVSDADAAAVNHDGIKAPLSNSLITFVINGNSVFGNEPRSLPRNSIDYTILDK